MDPSLRPYIVAILAPLFIALGAYLAFGRALPGQTRVLHIQLGVSSMVMGIAFAIVGWLAP